MQKNVILYFYLLKGLIFEMKIYLLYQLVSIPSIYLSNCACQN